MRDDIANSDCKLHKEKCIEKQTWIYIWAKYIHLKSYKQ